MEWLTELDEELRPLGPVPREVAHREGRLHGVVHCWVVSRRAEETRVWFQQRAHEKRDFPDYFDIAVGGHIDAGESRDAAALREKFVGEIRYITDLIDELRLVDTLYQKEGTV